MAAYKVADDWLIELVEEIRDEWHPDLEDARIGVLWRAVAPRGKSGVTFGAAKLPPQELEVFGKDFDFIVWFAKDHWGTLTAEQQRALVDHVLSHCTMRDGTAKMVGYDFFGFNAVVARHGLWWPSAEKTIEAVQPHFEFMRAQGSIEAVDPAAYNQTDVLDQVGGLLDDEEGDEE